MVQGGQWVSVTFGFSVAGVVVGVVVGEKEEVMGRKSVLSREALFSTS